MRLSQLYHPTHHTAGQHLRGSHGPQSRSNTACRPRLSGRHAARSAEQQYLLFVLSETARRRCKCSNA
eukprot:314553-Pleurochrysis_carterae.AAC.1